MSCILNIETSTNVCSVALSENGACIYEQEDHSGPNHGERLGTFVDEALSFADSHAIPVDAVAVSSGPAPIRACASAPRWPKASATVSMSS